MRNAAYTVWLVAGIAIGFIAGRPSVELQVCPELLDQCERGRLSEQRDRVEAVTYGNEELEITVTDSDADGRGLHPGCSLRL